MLVIGPETPQALRPLLAALVEAVRGLQAPGAPTALFACTAVELPPAAAWPNTLLIVSDLKVLAHSDGSDWIRADTGAPV